MHAMLHCFVAYIEHCLSGVCTSLRHHVDGQSVTPNTDCKSCDDIPYSMCHKNGRCMCLPGLRLYSDRHCGNMSDPNGKCRYYIVMLTY